MESSEQPKQADNDETKPTKRPNNLDIESTKKPTPNSVNESLETHEASKLDSTSTSEMPVSSISTKTSTEAQDASTKALKQSTSNTSLRASPPPFFPRFSQNYHQSTQLPPILHISSSPLIPQSPHTPQSPLPMFCSNHNDNQNLYTVTVHIQPDAEFTVQVGDETQTIQGSFI